MEIRVQFDPTPGNGIACDTNADDPGITIHPKLARLSGQLTAFVNSELAPLLAQRATLPHGKERFEMANKISFLVSRRMHEISKS